MSKKMMVWLHYNAGRNTDFLKDLESLYKEFKDATSGISKNCNCQNKSKVINKIWKDWHCTYCLKPKVVN